MSTSSSLPSTIGAMRAQSPSSLVAMCALKDTYKSKYAAKFHMQDLTEEDLFFYSSERLPSRIDTQATAKLFSTIKDSIILHYKALLEAQGWTFYAVNQTRGRCAYLTRRITIPTWAMQSRSVEYMTWYISHEIAHAFAGHTANHGDYFMAWLKVICPVHAIHHETSYKPRNATLQGISKEQTLNLLKDTIENLPDSHFL